MYIKKTRILQNLLIGILLFIPNICLAVEYIVPNKPASVDVTDIDLDGDLDIVIGHDPNSELGWGGISILNNNSKCEFTLVDSLYILSYQPSISISNVDNNEFPDFIAKCYDYQLETTSFEIIYDFKNEGFNKIDFFSCNETITISDYKIIYFDNDSLPSIVFYSNNSFLWGYMKNDGNGGFSSPVYYNLDYPPGGLACGDLNGDNRDDILVSVGGNIEAWLNFETGLQHTIITDSTYVYSIEIADVDNDGDNDIIAGVWFMPGAKTKVEIYSNDGHGNFQMTFTKWIDEALDKIFISDLNNDNYPDIIYNVTYSYPNSDYELFHTYILFNNQDGTFKDPVNYYTGICSHVSYAADLDGNGWNDIITLNYDFYNPPPTQGTIHILFNDGKGNFVEEPVGIEENEALVKNFELHQNYPNPFNSSTEISYSVKELSDIELIVYNSKGEYVSSIVNKKQEKGKYSFGFNAGNLTSGIYYYSLKINGVVNGTRKMLYLK